MAPALWPIRVMVTNPHEGAPIRFILAALMGPLAPLRLGKHHAQGGNPPQLLSRNTEKPKVSKILEDSRGLKMGTGLIHAPGWSWGSGDRARASRRQSFSARSTDNVSKTNPFAELFPAASVSTLPIKLGEKFYLEISALGAERDPEMFFEGMLRLGMRLEAEDRFEAAAEVYSKIVGAGLVSARGTDVGSCLSSIQNPCSGRGQAPPLPIIQKSQKRLDAMAGVGSTGHRAEFLLRRLTREALEPSTLIGLGAASAAFKVTRLATLQRLIASPAANFFTRGFGARSASSLAGFGVEATVFPLATRAGSMALGRDLDWSPDQLGLELASSYVILGAMKLAGWGAGLGGATGIPRQTRLQLGMLGGILLGHRIEEAAGLRPRLDGATSFVDSLAMLLQFNVAGRLTGRLLGEDFHRFQQRLDLEQHLLPDRVPLREARFAYAGASRAPASIHLSKMHAPEGGIGPALAEIAEFYRRRLPPDAPKFYAQGLIDTVIRISCDLPMFHSRLLQAFFAETRKWGSEEQYYRAHAIAEIFKIDALNSATGSLDNAMLQLLVGQIMADERHADRLRATQILFNSMERGINRAKISDIFHSFGYGEGFQISRYGSYSKEFRKTYGPEAAREWQDYREADQILLFSFIYHQAGLYPEKIRRWIRLFGEAMRSDRYRPEDIEAALDYARRHPLGGLVLHKMLHLFAVMDSPIKLLEIFTTTQEPDTFTFLVALSRGWKDSEAIAEAINGTRHNGYFHDMRLARKVVSVFQDIREFIEDPAKREKAKERLDKAFWNFLQSARPLSAADIVDLLETDGSPAFRTFKKMWKDGEVEIEVVPKEQLIQHLPGTGATDADAIFILRGDPTIPDLLLVKEMPAVDTSSWEGQVWTYRHLTYRLVAVQHEIEHWRHGRGYYSGVERNSDLIPFGELGRDGRLLSEVMADLEEHRWRIRNLDAEAYEIAKRLGEPLALYLRNFNDRAFFGGYNQKLAQVLESH